MGRNLPVNLLGPGPRLIKKKRIYRAAVSQRLRKTGLNASAPEILLTYLLHGAQPFFRSEQVFSQSRNSPHFVEPEGSLPQSQVPATCPCIKPARSSPYPASHFLKIHLNILPSTSGSPKWSLSFRFPHQNPVYASPLPHSRHRPRPSHSPQKCQPCEIP